MRIPAINWILFSVVLLLVMSCGGIPVCDRFDHLRTSHRKIDVCENVRVLDSLLRVETEIDIFGGQIGISAGLCLTERIRLLSSVNIDGLGMNCCSMYVIDTLSYISSINRLRDQFNCGSD